MNEIINLLKPLVAAATEWFTKGTRTMDSIKKIAAIGIEVAIDSFEIDNESYRLVDLRDKLEEAEFNLENFKNSDLISQKKLAEKFEEFENISDRKDPEYLKLKTELEGKKKPSYKVINRIEQLEDLPNEIKLLKLKIAFEEARSAKKESKNTKKTKALKEILSELK